MYQGGFGNNSGKGKFVFGINFCSVVFNCASGASCNRIAKKETKKNLDKSF